MESTYLFISRISSGKYGATVQARGGGKLAQTAWTRRASWCLSGANLKLSRAQNFEAITSNTADNAKFKRDPILLPIVYISQTTPNWAINKIFPLPAKVYSKLLIMSTANDIALSRATFLSTLSSSHPPNETVAWIWLVFQSLCMKLYAHKSRKILHALSARNVLHLACCTGNEYVLAQY